MGLKSAIEWTESTWNPVTGCTKISQGCKHCYAERMAERLQAMGQPNYRNGFQLTLQPQMLELPLRWKRPQRIFVNSMSDLFHQGVPLDYIRQVFDIMRKAHCRVDLGGCPPRPPTDPYVRDYRIRFFRSRFCYATSGRMTDSQVG
jgi:protein gp37